MGTSETNRRLAEITDQGKFECMATAVLREADSQYRLLCHPGVNADGKTVKAPVDGIVFVPGANPPHMIAVHHTICKRDDLEKKWLHDPSKVTPRKGGKTTAPAGDLVKTAKIFEEQKQIMPNLRATLILTTNQEPPESLIRTVIAAGQVAGLEVVIWPRSALAHFLDYDPKGQWIRKDFLQIEQEHLSEELLHELSRCSLEYSQPADDMNLWVDRALDRILEQIASRDVVFVVAESGLGKSVACYKRLTAHVEAGGFGLILPHDVVAEASSLNQAIDATLRKLHHSLVPGSGSEALALATEHTPFLIVMEDINKSSQPAVLIERLAGWSIQNKEGGQAANWQILCPVWPRLLTALGDEVRKRIDSLVLTASPFTAQEGVAAVLRRRQHAGISITWLEAETVSSALGHDPLLIALHNPDAEPDPDRVVQGFIESSLGRLAVDRAEFTAREYLDGLRQVATEMLERRILDLTMTETASWFGPRPDTINMFRHIARFGEIVHIIGPASGERLAFRHDRVRDWLLADAAADLMRRNIMPEAVLAEPFFAEIIGAALLCDGVPAAMVEQTRVLNPLALLCALRLFGEPVNEVQSAIIKAIESWLDEETTHRPDHDNLRWDATRILSECDSSYVIPIIQRFRKEQNDWWALRARFRNGDYYAGIELCRLHKPGVGVVGHLELIEYVYRHSGRRLVRKLDELLRGKELASGDRIGALRLAGHFGDSTLAGAIETSWLVDSERNENLAEYLWAGAQCCGEDPARLLDPICDAWAALPDEPLNQQSTSPRDNLAAYGIRWAFQKRLPEPAVRYFIERAKTPELQGQISYMLDGIDHPDAVEFIARTLATIDERLEISGGFSPFTTMAKDHWSRRQEETGHPMSTASKNRLRELWTNNTHRKHLRKQAFWLWSSTIEKGDIPILRMISESDYLVDLALWQRLRRGDQEAIPGLIVKLRQDKSEFWWQAGRYIWSDDLTQIIDEELNRRGAKVKRTWDSKNVHSTDWIVAECVLRLPARYAEELLIKHWNHLRFSPYFVQAALYAATPSLIEAVSQTVAECPNPKDLFAYLAMRFGYKTKGHPGITRIVQVQAVLQYLDHLSDMDILDLWETCNDHGWFELRRQYLDEHMKPNRRHSFIDDNSAMAELDYILTREHTYWLAGHWTEEFLKTGVNVDHLMSVVQTWLKRQTNIRALELAANVVIHVGNRSHLHILSDQTFEPIEQAASIIANASYALKRRSLS